MKTPTKKIIIGIGGFALGIVALSMGQFIAMFFILIITINALVKNGGSTSIGGDGSGCSGDSGCSGCGGGCGGD